MQSTQSFHKFSIEELLGFDKKEYQRQYNASEKGRNARKKYRHNNSKHTTDAVYLARRIVAVDGEGINIRRGRNRGQHLYVQLAVSGAAPIVNRAGLTTREILWYLWENLEPDNINVIYGGSYDFNCWLSSLVEDELRYVYKSGYTSFPLDFNGFRLRWITGKGFEIQRGTKTVIINDVISFFQKSFVDACDEYLGKNWIGRDIIVAEKKRRGNFTIEEIDRITEYNSLELDRLVDLVSELRLRLNKVGLRPRRWNSPGAIASALFQREKVKEHRNENLPEAVKEAARYAYAGGRFEMIRYGSVKETCYEYDINSAYPRALLEVPSLANGTWIHWEHTGTDTSIHNAAPYALYRVRFTGRISDIPAPLFVRAANGTITYPLNAENWIWSPEFQVLQEYCTAVAGASYELLESWEFQPSTDYKPFHFIESLYRKRQVLKAALDGAHIGIKLALNSLYGKLAQQVGWMPATAKFPLRIPTYHQLEWAGFVTSWCRANVLRAALTNINSIIAFETDAVFSTEPLDVVIGTGLGEWEETQFKSLTYVQSGHYYATKKDGKEVVKCRGIDKGFISRSQVEKLLQQPESERLLPAKLTRFIGAGIALVRGLELWRRWLTEPKVLRLFPTGKRVHGGCWCGSTGPLQVGKWHNTICPIWGGVSSEYPVEWINPNPEMREGITEERLQEKFYGSGIDNE